MQKRSGGRFARSQRLLDSRDFKRVSRQGGRVSSHHFVVLTAERQKDAPAGRGDDVARLGVTVSRAVGNAVTRNRIKRRIREWFRDYCRKNHNFRDMALDIVVIARKNASSLRTDMIFQNLDKLANERLEAGGGVHHGS